MKIALAILHSDPARGGAERYTVDLAQALGRRGHEVSLVAAALKPQVEVTSPTVEAPYRTVLLKGGGITRTRRYRRFVDSLDEHLKTETYDIVHAMLPVRQCDVYHPHAGIAASGARKANAIFNPRRRAMADVERALIDGPNAPTVITLSNYVERNLREFYPTAQTATLFNAVDLDKFDPTQHPEAGMAIRQELSIPNDAVVALMIAQDFERKGLRQAIEALSLVNDARLRLVVVGKESTAPYRRLAERLAVQARVTFAGPTGKPYAYYQAADLFVLPTKHDPCSLVVLEALAMGVPVISTTFNGATEVMTQGEHGVILPDPLDVAALANALRSMTDNDVRHAMHHACLTLRPRLAYETHLDHLLAIYHPITRNRPPLAE